jgi:hypothetical protein
MFLEEVYSNKKKSHLLGNMSILDILYNVYIYDFYINRIPSPLLPPPPPPKLDRQKRGPVKKPLVIKVHALL